MSGSWSTANTHAWMRDLTRDLTDGGGVWYSYRNGGLKNGKPAGLKGIVFLERDIENLENNSPRKDTFVFVNVVTRRTRKVRGMK